MTSDEVTWALMTVRDNAAVLGIDEALPGRGLFGAGYWNESWPECFVYEHGDHEAVHVALWHTDFGLGYQAAATCRIDPEASLRADVSADLFESAFATSGPMRVGSHVVNYGWLFDDAPGYWPGDPSGQDELFHREQTFWVRFGEP